MEFSVEVTEKGAKSLLVKIMAVKFPNLRKNITKNSRISKSSNQDYSKGTNTETHKHTVKRQRQNPEISKRKMIGHTQGISHEVISRFLSINFVYWKEMG